MTLRNIVKIDEEKCNGCGQCVKACAEGAIKIIDGKAKLISEIYCDGLGACIGHCPQDAITVEKRQAAQFDEQAAKKHLANENLDNFVCPSITAKSLRGKNADADSDTAPALSHLGQWPVQLKLVSPNAPYFADCDLLLVADCVPFAMGDFHSRFLKDHSIAIGCPKLDDVNFYIAKLADILQANKLKTLTVIHMQVPCCSGLTYIAQQAIARSSVKMAFKDITIDLRGNIINTETIEN